MKALIKALLRKTPYRLVRNRGGNRFSVIEEALKSLRNRGFSPHRIIDGGANTGEFSRFALEVFPEAFIHAIEPQPGCAGALLALSSEAMGRLEVHQFGLCDPEQDGSMLELAADLSSTSTGAHVVLSSHTLVSSIAVPCISLDKLLANVRSPQDCALLKLDLQGYELHALRGATETLKTCDVVITEVSFYAQAYEPPISELIAFLAQLGFELYDIAAIYARPRDDRPRQGDFIFIRKGSHLALDMAWE